MLTPRDVLAAMAALTLGTAACSKKKPPVHSHDETATGSSTAHKTGTSTDRADDTRSPDRDDDVDLAVNPVYFEFNSAELSERGRDDLTRIASWLARHPGAKLHVEGHTDDRGTTEYNMGLGDRRAQVIADYIVRLGIERERLDTITYGEERPAVEGETEDAWAKNRRGGLAVDK